MLSSGPISDSPDSFAFNAKYLLPNGLIRIAIILLTFGAWVAMASAVKNSFLFENSVFGLFSTRVGFLVILIVACFFSVIIFCTAICNLVRIPSFAAMYWFILVIVLDILFALAIIAISIAAAVRESQVAHSPFATEYHNNRVNSGAYAVAAAFGFASAICLCCSAVASLVYMSSRSKKEQELYQGYFMNNMPGPMPPPPAYVPGIVVPQLPPPVFYNPYYV